MPQTGTANLTDFEPAAAAATASLDEFQPEGPASAGPMTLNTKRGGSVVQAISPAPKPTIQERIGSMVPQGTVPWLQRAQKYAVEPFEKAASAGAKAGGEIAEGTAARVVQPFAAPELATNPPADPMQEMERRFPVTMGVSKGTGEVAGGMVTDPRNWPFFASGAARPLLQRLTTSGFRTMLGVGAVSAAKKLHDEWDSLTPVERSEIATQGGLSAALAGGADKISEHLKESYEGLPTEPGARSEALFRNLVYKAGGEVPEHPTYEQANAAYKAAMQNLHPDVNPEQAQDATTLNQAWAELKKAGWVGQTAPVQAPPQQALPPPTDIPQPSEPHPGAPVDQMAQGASNAVGYANEEAQAIRMVSGLPPTPPPAPTPPAPGPPIPPEISQGHISQDTAARIGTMIAKLPADLRAQATAEAHQTLSQSILQMGKVVTPSGQLEIITKPEQADKVAQRIINSEVARQEKILAESQNAAAAITAPVAVPVSRFEQGLRARRAVKDVSTRSSVEQATPVTPVPAVPGGEQAEALQNSGTASLKDFTPQSSGPAAPPAVSSKTGTAALSDLAPTNFVKGDQVVLPDGAKATVSWVSPRLSIVRVKTEQGKVISIGARQLKPAQQEPVTPAGWMARQTSTEERPEQPAHKNNSTQINLPETAATRVKEAGQVIPDKDLAGNGRENEPHITVKYGVNDQAAEILREKLAAHPPFEAKLGKIRVFPPTENSDGAAVVHAEVNSPELKTLHAEIDKHVGSKKDDFEYRPHVTLAYVKPELAHKYEGRTDLEGTKIPVNAITVSQKDGKHIDVPLGGKHVSEEKVPGPPLVSERTKPIAPRPPISGQQGGDTTLNAPNGNLPARYRVVEAADLVPSHNSQTFGRNANYPEGIQERTYDTSKEAQARVIQQTQKYDPNYTINTNPDAVNGPPIITPDGTVLGGNSRAMSTQRLYKAGRGNIYKNALLAQAQTFGLDKEAIRLMTEPVLVREVAQPENLEATRRLASDLNKSMTGALGVSERAVSAGRSITQESLEKIGAMMDSMGPDTSLRDLMRERGNDLVSLLVRDGVITERERPWENSPGRQMSLMLLYHLLAVHALYYAPIYGWLLLVSGWARRAAFLWAGLPLLAIGVVEKIAFNSSHFAAMMGSRIGGVAEAADIAAPGSVLMHPLTLLTVGKFLISPGLWIGLAVAAAFLAAAVRLRRYQGPI